MYFYPRKLLPKCVLSLAVGASAAVPAADAKAADETPILMLVEVFNAEPLEIRTTPLGIWKDAGLELLEGLRREYAVVCPEHLSEPTQCGSYRLGDESGLQELKDTVYPELKDAPVTVNGVRVGTFDGTIVADGAIEYSTAMASWLPIGEPHGWRRVDLADAELVALENRARAWLELHRSPQSPKLGELTQFRTLAFETASGRVEFVAVGFEVDPVAEGGSSFAASLAWGLVQGDAPFVLYEPQLIGDRHFHYLIQAADFGDDGTTELILYDTDNQVSSWDVWQQQADGSYRQIAAITR